MPFYPGCKQKPSLYERVDQGKVEDPLLGEGGPAKPGRVWGGTRSDLVPPLFRQGFALPPSPRGRLRTLSWERVDRAEPGTGVGRDKVGPGTAPLPPPAGGTFPQGKVKGPISSLSYWCRRWSCHGHGPRSGSGNTPSGCRRWRRSCLHSCPRRRPWPR